MKYYCSQDGNSLKTFRFERNLDGVESFDQATRIVSFGNCRMIAKEVRRVLELTEGQTAALIALLAVDFRWLGETSEGLYLGMMGEISITAAELSVVANVHRALYSSEYETCVHIANLNKGLSTTLVFVG